MDFNSIIAFVACIFFIFIVSKIFIVPIKIILKLILNSILGGVTIFLINAIGSLFGFHIGINIITSIFVGLLGMPGAIAIILIKLLF